jgi:hypothetical protein
VLIKLCLNSINVHSSVFDLDNYVSFRVNEQQRATVSAGESAWSVSW